MDSDGQPNAPFVPEADSNFTTTGEHAKTDGAYTKTTADELYRCAVADVIPEDKQTRQDFGFDKCCSSSDQSKLLGIYRTVMVTFSVEPALLNQWRLGGGMAAEIGKVLDQNNTFFKTHQPLFAFQRSGNSPATDSPKTGQKRSRSQRGHTKKKRPTVTDFLFSKGFHRTDEAFAAEMAEREE